MYSVNSQAPNACDFQAKAKNRKWVGREMGRGKDMALVLEAKYAFHATPAPKERTCHHTYQRSRVRNMFNRKLTYPRFGLGEC